MRVAVNVEQILSESPGGVGRYSRQLATLLPATAPADEVVAFVARHRPAVTAAAMAAAGVTAPVVTLPLPRQLLWDTWNRWGLPPLTLGAAALADVDVVHAPSLAVPPRAGPPLVVTVHDAAVEHFPGAFTRRGRVFHRRGAQAAAERADAVIAVSEAAADEIVSATPITAAQIRVVHHGVAAPVVDPAGRDAALAARGLTPGGYVLWVGSLEPRKDVGTLVAAAAALKRRGRPLGRLVLAGYRGWLQAGLVDGADRAEMGEDLVTLGPVGEDELWALYAGAAVFALPSRHEGFGLPVVEAMSQGAPVVCSDLAVLREVTAGAAVLATPGDVGVWADTLAGLLDDAAARDRLAAAGRDRAGWFSVERLVAGTRAVYREVQGL